MKDFTAWQQAYRAAAPVQKRAGALAESVLQADDDTNDVTVTHEFKSLAEAKGFVGSSGSRTRRNLKVGNSDATSRNHPDVAER